MARPKSGSIEEDWVKVSEARYDSMKHLLQSVKNDIDALTQKIDSTQKSPVLYRTDTRIRGNIGNFESVPLSTNATQKNSTGMTVTHFPCDATSINQPDLLANVSKPAEIRPDNEFTELDDLEEYMEIRIREERNPFNYSQNLMDCTIATVNNSDLPGSSSSEDRENKTWRSPSDFSLRDPFEEAQLGHDFGNQTDPSGIHVHAVMKETDLDDGDPVPFDREAGSDGSLSPAVSPTFEIYAAEAVQIKDMLLSNEETAALGLKPEEPVEKSVTEDEYQVYEDGHSLTTIDEASEEVEDDWSSSEHDSFLNSNDGQKEHVTSKDSHKQSVGCDSPVEKAIDNSLKFTTLDTSQAHAAMNETVHEVHSGSATLKKTDLSNSEQTFVFDFSAIKQAEPNSKSTECVILRPKRCDPDSPGKQRQNQRPISMGSIRGAKDSEKSPIGSVHSAVSTFSQESIISEAESYVTVCSRFATGSDDIYTTACSDSEVPGLPAGASFGPTDDECPTLSRKRTKVARSQRSRARGHRADHMSSSSSNSSIEEQEAPLTPCGKICGMSEGDRQSAGDTMVRNSEALTVTPKFSRLPSKLASPNDLSNITSSDLPVNHVLIESHLKIQKSEPSSPVLSGAVESTATHKRTVLQRPVRQSPLSSPEQTGTMPNTIYMDADLSGSDESATSESSSSSGDEADYDASEPIIWTAYPVSVPVSPPGTTLPPNLIYKPSFQTHFDLSELQRKRLSRIDEAAFAGGGSSANEGGESDSEGTGGPDSPAVQNRHPDQSSDERQSDSGVVIIPKYTYQSFDPEFAEAVGETEGMHSSESIALPHFKGIQASNQNKLEITLAEPPYEPTKGATQQSALSESANRVQARENVSQSVPSSNTVSVPPLAGRPTIKQTSPVPNQVTGGVQQSAAYSDGDRRLETSANFSCLTDAVEAEPKFLTQTSMYANTNYYYPPEILGSGHIYHDRIRTTTKPTGHTESKSRSSMHISLPPSKGEECTPLPLAAVLSSAEAKAARPCIYSPTQGDSADSPQAITQTNEIPQHLVGSIPASDRLLTCSTRDFPPKCNTQSPENGSNDHPSHHAYQFGREVSVVGATHATDPQSTVVLETAREGNDSQNYNRLEKHGTTIDNHRCWSPGTVGESAHQQDSHFLSRQQPRLAFDETRIDGDIQAASQRTSRIIHGNSEFVDSSVRLLGGPQIQAPMQTSHLCTNSTPSGSPESEWSHSTGRVAPVSSAQQTDKPAIIHDGNEQSATREKFAEYPITIPYGKPHESTDRSRVVQLMQAPKHTSTPNDPIANKNFEPHRLRNISPSPPRSGDLRLLISKSLDVKKTQAKWQLRPIPTETEIRERLRSRSRQRVEERQSRAQRSQASLTQTFRPRSSRSDSRYRCTDLDSAIAESRADTAESGTMHSSVHESEPLSEAKQSASLFDLDARMHRLSTTSPLGLTQTQDEIKSERKFFGDAKSYNSLLETDIDTGENFERPMMLETDVDRLETRINSTSAGRDETDNKTQSLFNLCSVNTPGPYRCQDTSELHEDDHGISNPVGSPQPTTASIENWQRTKSLQGLPHRSQDSSDLKSGGDFCVLNHRSRATGIGAKGLIERLRDRAKSSYELRIAQSLTKLRVPDWLDKAECLSRNSVQERDLANIESELMVSPLNSQLKISSGSDLRLIQSKPLLSSTRSLSSSRKAYDYSTTCKWLRKSPIVETVAEPTWSRSAGSSGATHFVRPSQQFRERGESLSRLKPIHSKLYSSMRSLASNRPADDNQTSDILRPQVAPRLNRDKVNGLSGQSAVFQLSPQDFMPRHEQLWGRNTDVLPRRYGRSNTEPRSALGPSMEAARTFCDKRNERQLNNTDQQIYGSQLSNIDGTQDSTIPPVPPHQTTKKLITLEDDIKPADYDSGTEQSSESGNLVKRNNSTRTSADPHDTLCSSCPGDHIPVSASAEKTTSEMNAQRDWESAKESKQKNTEINRFPDGVCNNPSSSQDQSIQDEPSASEWRLIDAEGESESEATDGLDQISDLTCLTNLIDTCAARHRALLANRPSALEHLLTSLGWWPSNPPVEHQHLPPTAAEAISIAAHEFDVDEDSHRHEFLQLLQGPESRRPMNLGEFALNHLSGAVQRKQRDGLLYISCGRAECMKPPVQVQQASDWPACANCYTLYCSATCRALDRRSTHDHPTVCSFARAKRACNRVLRNLASGQITGLTALAKTGMARLGRGGILLPFALIHHAELFLKRAQSHSWSPPDEANDTSVEHAAVCWERDRQPSPGGLIAPPLYLTLQELQELDSTVANPCRTYSPSTSMVLIIVVCAYELIARADGRPVHLFKQSLILPFPAHNLSNGKRQLITNRSTPVAPALPDKPALPQTNGLLSRPDRQATAAREAYMIRLQRMLRERGVSLRHHHPEIYMQIANFVETGIPFSPVRITFHDFILREEVVCIIRPMHDPQIYPTRQVRSQSSGRHADYYEEVQNEPMSKPDPPASGAKKKQTPVPANQHPRWQETNF